MKKQRISEEARKTICTKIMTAYEGYNDLIAHIVENGILYYSIENGVVWVWDSITFTEFLNIGEVNTKYAVYRFRLVNNELVTVEA